MPVLSLFIGFLTRLTQRVLLVEQELLTLTEHPSSSPGLTLWSHNSITSEMFQNNNFVNKGGQNISVGRIHQNVGLVE